jgi:hypothetical protein
MEAGMEIIGKALKEGRTALFIVNNRQCLAHAGHFQSGFSISSTSFNRFMH